MTDQIKKVAIGWCLTCDTNDCEHMLNITQSLVDYFRATYVPEKKVKLKGLTGEPWRD
jgi:hypothetical protein